MTTQEALTAVRYVVNSNGERTDVMIPWKAWNQILAAWQTAVEELEDREDIAIFSKWLERRETGTAERISIEDLEQELIADGLLSG